MKKNKQITTEQLLLTIQTLCPNAILLEGFDKCIVAVHIGLPNRTNVIYSRSRIIDTLMKRDGISYGESIEFFDLFIVELKFDLSITPYYINDALFNFSLN
jgi:hypothetical protein